MLQLENERAPFVAARKGTSDRVRYIGFLKMDQSQVVDAAVGERRRVIERAVRRVTRAQVRIEVDENAGHAIRDIHARVETAQAVRAARRAGDVKGCARAWHHAARCDFQAPLGVRPMAGSHGSRTIVSG